MKYFNVIILSIGLLFTSISAQDLISQEIDRLEEVFIEEAANANTKMLTFSAVTIIAGVYLLSDPLSISFGVEEWSKSQATKFFGGFGLIGAGLIGQRFTVLPIRDIKNADDFVRNEARAFAKKNLGPGIKLKAKKVAKSFATDAITKF